MVYFYINRQAFSFHHCACMSWKVQTEVWKSYIIFFHLEQTLYLHLYIGNNWIPVNLLCSINKNEYDVHYSLVGIRPGRGSYGRTTIVK